MIDSYSALQALLRADGVMHQSQSDGKTLAVPIRREGLQSAVLLMWQADEGVLQLLLALPFEVPDANLAALESAILKINHALPLPGFGLNHEHNVAYYRIAMPIGDGIPPGQVRRLFSTAVAVSTQFLEPLKAVAEGAPAPA